MKVTEKTDSCKKSIFKVFLQNLHRIPWLHIWNWLQLTSWWKMVTLSSFTAGHLGSRTPTWLLGGGC